MTRHTRGKAMTTEIKSVRFGTLTTETEVLPAIAPLLKPARLDAEELEGDAEGAAAFGQFLDALDEHLTKMKAQFMSDYEEVAEFVPGWLDEEASDLWNEIFVEPVKPDDVDATRLWSVMFVKDVWAGDATSFVIDMGFHADIDHVICAYFAPDGTLTDLGMES